MLRTAPGLFASGGFMGFYGASWRYETGSGVPIPSFIYLNLSLNLQVRNKYIVAQRAVYFKSKDKAGGCSSGFAYWLWFRRAQRVSLSAAST